MTDPAQILGLKPDEGEYGPPLPQRPGRPASASTVLVVMAALVVGLVLTTGISSGRGAAEVQDARRAELMALIEARQARVEALQDQLDELRARVAQAEATAGTPTLQRLLTEAEQLAGLTALRGPGLRVTFDDASGGCRGSQPQDCQIQDTDLQLAVNALFAAGAEGVAINAERVITTTAIRGAGRAILVNYRVLSPPYVVEAVGDASRLAEGFADSHVARDFSVWRDTYGLGFAVSEARDLELPPYSGSLHLRSATLMIDGAPR